MLVTFMDNLLAHTIVHVIGDVRKATMSLSCDFVGPAYPGQRMEGWGVNGGGIMRQSGGAKMYHGLGGSLSP